MKGTGTLIQAWQLKRGSVFCLSNRKNAKRYKVSTTADEPFRLIPSHLYRWGRLLIILENCRQMTLYRWDEIYLIE